MSKKIYERTYIIGLYDCYGQLLTKSQKEVFDGYYGCDLSLGEIAENRGISRSAVDDSLSRSCTKLEDYENKLHYYEKKNKLKTLLEEENYEELERMIKNGL